MRAFFSCLAWRAIPSPLSKLKRRLDTLESTQWAPRDPCHDFRGKRSPLLPLQASPDPPGGSGMETRDPCLPLRGILGPGHTPRLGLFGPVVTRAEPPAFPRIERLPPVKTWGWEIHQQASSLATLGCQGHSGSDCAPFPAFSHQRLRPASGNPPVLLKIVLGLTDLLTNPQAPGNLCSTS